MNIPKHATTRKRSGIALATAAALLGSCATLAQPPAAAPPSPAAQAHIDTARALAGDDLAATFEFFCVPGKARPNNFSAPPMTPTRLFDNLYAVGNSESVVYALTTSDGIVLIDAGHPGDIDTLVLPGLAALGLDPADIRYVLIAHGHVDHYGGAAFLQQRGARIGATAADWDTMAAEAPSALFGAVPKPERDLVLSEAEPLVVGDTTITLVEVPGHTPGALGFIFPVRDGSSTHVAGMFGGTVLAAGFTPLPGLKQYLASIDHFLESARQHKVDVEIQNHPIFDDMQGRLDRLAARLPGAPHPFVMGEERYSRFWNLISACMQSTLIQRESAQ